MHILPSPYVLSADYSFSSLSTMNLTMSCKVKLLFITKCNVTVYQIALTGLPDENKKGGGGGYKWEIVIVLKIIIKFEV